MIERALMIAPADRYQTAAQLEAALAAVEPFLSKPSGVSHPALGVTGRSMLASRSRRWWMLGGALLTAALGAATIRFRNAGDTAPVDENRLVVVPFNVLDPADTVWRAGLVDVLSRNFDGAGPIHTVPPTASMRAWKAARADAETAMQLGRQTHAGLALFGQLVRAGHDSVRLTASLLDLNHGRTFEVEARDEFARIDRLADSLTVRVLRELGTVRPIAAVPRASLGSKSLPALKAFLQGEQLYRTNRVLAARDAYLNAIALDTGFALAYRRMRGVWRVIAGLENDSTGFSFALRAGERNHGLGTRDSLLIVADSLAAAKAPGSVFLDDAGVRRLRRRVSALAAAVRLYADDPEIQFEFGEAAYHIGERVGLSQRQALNAFLESIRLDPAFSPSYYHAIELSLPLDGVEATAALAQRFDALNPQGHRYRLFVQLLRQQNAQGLEGLIASTDQLSANDVLEAIELTRRWPDSLDTAVRLSERLLHRAGLSHADSASARFWLASTLLFRRLAKAHATLTPDIVRGNPEYLFQLAMLGVAPADSAIRIGQEWADRVDARGLYLSIPLRASLGDSASLQRMIRQFKAQIVPGKVESVVRQSLGVRSANAWLALLRRDTATALREFLARPDSLCSWWCFDDRLATARLLQATGRARDALVHLNLHPPGAGPTSIAEPMWLLEWLRAQRAINPTESYRDLEFVRQAWARADSSLRSVLRTSTNAPKPDSDRTRPVLRGSPSRSTVEARQRWAVVRLTLVQTETDANLKSWRPSP